MIMKWISLASVFASATFQPTYSFLHPNTALPTLHLRNNLPINTQCETPWVHQPPASSSPSVQIRPPPTTTPKSSTSLNISAAKTRNLAVAGRIPWRKLLISKSQAIEIISIMRAESQYFDLAIMICLFFFGEHIGKFLYEHIFSRLRRKSKKEPIEYEDSITYKIQENIGQAAILGVVCYCFDMIEIVLEVTGIKGSKVDFSSSISKLIYATWAALRIRAYKRNFFEVTFDKVDRRLRRIKGTQGKVEIFDKITDFFLFGILALTWIDILKIKPGTGLSSLFALGGAGTLAFTLACQDLAKKVLNGLALSTTDPFSVGEQIALGDGTTGTVNSIGWLSTQIRGSDEIVTTIPNTDLSNVRVKNISRMRQSQVKQTLNFRYQDIHRLPDVIEEIKKEIASSCPKVITDGSRPFRVCWTDYGKDSLEVIVDCRLRNPPFGDGYFNARQGILEAISRAVVRKGADFCPPTQLKVAFEDKKDVPDLFIQDV